MSSGPSERTLEGESAYERHWYSLLECRCYDSRNHNVAHVRERERERERERSRVDAASAGYLVLVVERQLTGPARSATPSQPIVDTRPETTVVRATYPSSYQIRRGARVQEHRIRYRWMASFVVPFGTRLDW